MSRPYLVWHRKIDGTVISGIEDIDPAAVPADVHGFVSVPVVFLGDGRISIAPADMRRLRDFLSPPSVDDTPTVRP